MKRAVSCILLFLVSGSPHTRKIPSGGTRWMQMLAVVGVMSAPLLASAAESFVLANPRFDPQPPEAYGRLTLQVGFAGAAAPVVRLWSRIVREGQQVEPTAVELRPPVQGPTGRLWRSWELGEPGPRRLNLVAEDAQGARSAPLDLSLQLVEPPRRFEELTYLSDGLRIKGYLYLPPGLGPAPPVIIYSHGSLQRAELATPHRFEWLAYRLARLGYAVFVAERRGYGGSEGEGVVGGEGVNNLRHGLPQEVKDVISAIEFLKGHPEIDGTRIALLGKSLGGLVSLLAAAERPDLRGVISLAGGYGFGDRLMGPTMLYIQTTLRSAARRIQIPTLIMHVQNDRTVPVDFSRIVYDELRQRDVTATVKIYPPFEVAGKGMEGHTLFDRVDGLAYFWSDLTGFLAQTVRP